VLLPDGQARDLQLLLHRLVLDTSLPFARPDLEALARHDARLHHALHPHDDHEGSR
jgi:hypothetical protein